MNNMNIRSLTTQISITLLCFLLFGSFAIVAHARATSKPEKTNQAEKLEKLSEIVRVFHMDGCAEDGTGEVYYKLLLFPEGWNVVELKINTSLTLPNRGLLAPGYQFILIREISYNRANFHGSQVIGPYTLPKPYGRYN